MTFDRPRTGIVALVEGREYLADAPPEGGVVVLRSDTAANPDDALFAGVPGAWVASVAVGDCQRLDEVITLADYLGHECQVVGVSADGSVGLTYLGPDRSKAAADGFVQVDPGTWARNVNVFELVGFRERHTDLLFGAWVAAGLR